MKIDKLGYYKTRDGQVATVTDYNTMHHDSYHWFGAIHEHGSIDYDLLSYEHVWTCNGNFYDDGKIHKYDLIKYLGPLET